MPKSDPGRRLGGPKLTQDATLEAEAAKKADLEARKPSRTPIGGGKGPQEANLRSKKRPRTPTWSQNGAKRDPKGGPRGSKNEAREQK